MLCVNVSWSYEFQGSFIFWITIEYINMFHKLYFASVWLNFKSFRCFIQTRQLLIFSKDYFYWFTECNLLEKQQILWSHLFINSCYLQFHAQFQKYKYLNLYGRYLKCCRIWLIKAKRGMMTVQLLKHLQSSQYLAN